MGSVVIVYSRPEKHEHLLIEDKPEKVAKKSWPGLIFGKLGLLLLK